jgi:TatD DNase family protein
MLHDTHAHLDLFLQKLGEMPEIVSIDTNPVKKSLIDNLLVQHDFVIQPTTDTNNFWSAYKLLNSCEKVFFLLGSHPEIVKPDFNLGQYQEGQRDVIVQMETDNDMSQKIIGIGEIGLDYHYSQNPEIIKKQIALFEEQLALAIKLKLPVVIHCREAFKDLFGILKEYPEIHGHFLVHCFTDDMDALKQILRYGGKVGLGGVSTFKSAQDLQEAIKFCPKDCYVLETDLPFLAPTPHRGEMCTPDMIDIIAQKVADLKQQPKSDIWSHSLTNTRSLFGVFL